MIQSPVLSMERNIGCLSSLDERNSKCMQRLQKDKSEPSKDPEYGFEVQKNYKDALRIDKENSNTRWQDAIDLELD